MFVIHECGHHTRPEAFEILERLEKSKKQIPDGIHGLFNIAEDDGMERSVAHAYKGDALSLGEGNAVCLGQLRQQLKDKDMPTDLTADQIAPLAGVNIGQLSRLDWDFVPNPNRSRFFNEAHKDVQSTVNDLVDEGWVDKFRETEDPKDTWKLSIDLYQRLYPDADPDECEAIEKIGLGTAKQQDKKKVPDKKKGKGKPKGTGNDAGTSDKDGDAGLPEQGQIVSWKDVTFSEHNWKPKDEDQLAGNLGVTWEDFDKGGIKLLPQSEINLIDLSDSYWPVCTNDHRGMGAPSTFTPNNKQSRQFANQVRRYLQATQRTKIVRDKYHGRLDKGAIVKIALPPIDGGEYNKRLFYDYDKRKAFNTCIHVLTDWSGSMSGDKMVYAADATGRLIQTLDRVLHIPVQSAAFTDGRSTCDIGIIKKFNERRVTDEEIGIRFSRFKHFTSANDDADAVLWAYNQIKNRKEDRKILIVLSDGAPAGGINGWGGGHNNLLHVCKEIEKCKKVELYGVGILSDAVEAYYTNHKVINDASEINQVLFTLIKQGDRA
jgi:hypothetical protein